MTEPEVLTLVQLSRRLRCSQSNAARGIAEGKLPGVKVGGRYLIRREWVERFERGESGFWSPTGHTKLASPFIRHA